MITPIKKVSDRIEECRPNTVGFATPVNVAKSWLHSLFEVYENIKSTSLNDEDKRQRLDDLAEKISQ